MSDSKDKEVESLIKNAISGMEYGSYHIINTNGPYWRKIEDLASTHGIFCQSCFNPIWICECYTKESMERYRNYPPNTAFVFPKKCSCQEKRIMSISNIGYTKIDACCKCTVPFTPEQFIELGETIKKRIYINDINSKGSNRIRAGWMKVYGDQIASLQEEVDLLKKALADALEALAQK